MHDVYSDNASILSLLTALNVNVKNALFAKEWYLFIYLFETLINY